MSASFCWVAEYTMSSPRLAMPSDAASSPKSMWRQGAERSCRMGRPRGPVRAALAVAISRNLPPSVRSSARDRDGAHGLAGEALEDATGHGRGGGRPEAGFLHEDGHRELGRIGGREGGEHGRVLLVAGLGGAGLSRHRERRLREPGNGA